MGRCLKCITSKNSIQELLPKDYLTSLSAVAILQVAERWRGIQVKKDGNTKSHRRRVLPVTSLATLQILEERSHMDGKSPLSLHQIVRVFNLEQFKAPFVNVLFDTPVIMGFGSS